MRTERTSPWATSFQAMDLLMASRSATSWMRRRRGATVLVVSVVAYLPLDDGVTDVMDMETQLTGQGHRSNVAS